MRDTIDASLREVVDAKRRLELVALLAEPGRFEHDAVGFPGSPRSGKEAARAFYEKQGFVAVEFTDGTGNEARRPDVRYRWAAD